MVNILNGEWQCIADWELGGKAEGASPEAIRLGHRNSGPCTKAWGKDERGDQLAPSGFPLCFVILIPDFTSILRFSGGRGLRESTSEWDRVGSVRDR